MIELNDVCMRYPVPRRYHEYLLRPFHRRLRTALVGVNLTIPSGQCVGIVGSNGAGKTTLLRVAGGLLYPSAGTVRVAGFDTRKHPAAVRRRVGYVLNEERSFYWRLTGRQNLEFFAALDDVFGRDASMRIGELAERVGLADAMDTRVAFYSCGMRQRLALARAMLTDSDVLILDEPTRSIDPFAAGELRSLILETVLSHRDRTVLLASNQFNDIEAMCDVVYVVSRGHVSAAGTLKDVRERPGGLVGLCRSALEDDANAVAIA